MYVCARFRVCARMSSRNWLRHLPVRSFGQPVLSAADGRINIWLGIYMRCRYALRTKRARARERSTSLAVRRVWGMKSVAVDVRSSVTNQQTLTIIIVAFRVCAVKHGVCVWSITHFWTLWRAQQEHFTQMRISFPRLCVGHSPTRTTHARTNPSISPTPNYVTHSERWYNIHRCIESIISLWLCILHDLWCGYNFARMRLGNLSRPNMPRRIIAHHHTTVRPTHTHTYTCQSSSGVCCLVNERMDRILWRTGLTCTHISRHTETFAIHLQAWGKPDMFMYKCIERRWQFWINMRYRNCCIPI